MALATYSDLQTSVANWLLRDDLTAVIPDFITLAEALFNRTLRTADQETEATLTAGATAYIDLPADLAEIRWITPTTPPDKTLRVVSPIQGDDLYTSTTGTTVAYAVVGNRVKLYPPPSTGTTFTLHYYAKVPALSDAAPTNWLLTEHPDLYLYAALLQSAPYLGDDQRLGTWGKLYDNAKADLTASDMALRWNGAQILVTGP